MPAWSELVTGVVINLVTEIIVVVVGIFIAQFIRRIWDEWRYGRWIAIVRRNNVDLVRRKVSAGKAKEILGESSDLSVFLKGLVSPYAQLHCDIIEVDKQPGLLLIDHDARQFVINLDKNPPKSKEDAPVVL